MVRSRFRLPDKDFKKIAGLQSVRARLRLVGDQIAARTRANLAAADSAVQVSVEEGTRSNGRAYVRVAHGDRIGEYGTETVKRHRASSCAVGSKCGATVAKSVIAFHSDHTRI